MSLLQVNGLQVAFPTHDGIVQAVRGISFAADTGETLGIVGESGSGKSVAALTLLGLTAGADIHGSALFEGRDLLSATPRQLRHIRGAEVAMVFQDPLSSLHPQYRVGWQIAEAIRAHTNAGRREARRHTIELLREVSIPHPEQRIDSYPHELSGGMRQRVMLAMALALRPTLLIADEPTTALDATVQAQIIQLIGRLQRQLGMAVIIITHDLGVVARIADSVLVMYAGRVAEKADRHTLYYGPHHPYTCGLLRSVPAATGVRDRLVPIPGQPPSLINPPTGCAFHPRCAFAMARCVTTAPPLREIPGATHHRSACWLPPELTGVAEEVTRARRAFAESDPVTFPLQPGEQLMPLAPGPRE